MFEPNKAAMRDTIPLRQPIGQPNGQQIRQQNRQNTKLIKNFNTLDGQPIVILVDSIAGAEILHH